MGVRVPSELLHPIKYVGTTYESHTQLECKIDGGVVAIDATQVRGSDMHAQTHDISCCTCGLHTCRNLAAFLCRFGPWRV